MKRGHSRPGFVIGLAFVMMVCVGIMLTGVYTYVCFATRYVTRKETTPVLIAAAQSEIERFKVDIVRQFSLYLARRNVHVGINYDNALSWFDSVTCSGGSISIGRDGCVATRARQSSCSTTEHGPDDISVTLGAKRNVWDGGTGSVVLIATATKGEESVTVAELVRIADPNPPRSSVFEYAYFVNNYGWMNGTSIIVNGDMRANGDMSITGSVVNGHIWAAPNAEVGADGEISFAPVTSGSWYGSTSTYPSIWTRDAYWSGVSSSARPTSPPSEGAEKWSGGFDAPKNKVTYNNSTLSNPKSDAHKYVHENADPLAMPFISDLSDYRAYATELRSSSDPGAGKGTLKYREVNIDPTTGALSMGSSTRQIDINNYINDDNINTPFANEMIASAQPGPSGDPEAGDRGALVLVGTKDHPIEIDGPVIIASDVIIMGYVKGQGTIYSGRNIHIVGDLVYSDPPTWSHPDNNPEQTQNDNKGKDLVSLMAKGCVVVGNCVSTSWKNSIEPYVDMSSDYTREYYCDDNDTSIGYPSSSSKFNANYAAQTLNQDEVPKYYDSAYAVPVTWTVTETLSRGKVTKTTTSSASYGTPVLKPLDTPYSGLRNLGGETMDNQTVSQVTTSTTTSRKTKYTAYEVIGNKNAPHYTGIESYLNTNYKGSRWQYDNEGARYYDTLCGDWALNAVAQNGNQLVFGKGAGVAKINAVIYDNHGTFGTVGRSKEDFVLNGSLICRDEALVGGVTDLKNMIFNWDVRLKEGSPGGVGNNKLSLPVGLGTPRTLIWQQVPDAWNATLSHEEGD